MKGNPCGKGGTCINIEGEYECYCEPGYVLSPDGHSCVDMRKDMCFMKYEDGQCKMPMSRPQTRTVCCCSMGAGWGSKCESCPKQGSPEYQEACGIGTPGMMVDPISGAKFEINECDLMPGICKNGQCINTIGGFKCECNVGYVYDESSHQCIDKNECLQTGQSCLAPAQCINTPGSFKCSCPDGYKLDASGFNCSDIDECTSGHVCRNGQCTNMDGSFSCECNEGFVLGGPKKDTCVDDDECTLNPFICGNNGTCFNKFGSYRCSCRPGFQVDPSTGAKECVDIDECKSRFGLCQNGRCRNVPGDFTCECADGYQAIAGNHACRDINECSASNICPPPGICLNKGGSFHCQCPKGYKLSRSGRKCKDVNECSGNSNLCKGGFCVNTEGSFKCECPLNWSLSPDGRYCIDNRKEKCYNDYRGPRFCTSERSQLVTRRTCCCSMGKGWGNDCSSCPRPESPEFQELCPLGPGRGDNGEDFDECSMLDNLCEYGTCINTDGSYRCECPTGYKLDAEGKACIDDNECVSSGERICGNGTCTNKVGGFECSCNVGFTPGPQGICEDINECVESSVLCAFRCHNTPGSYRCVCPYGYAVAPDGSHCEDIDECSTAANNCRYDCKNLIGSFICVCPDGYRKVGSTGSDECEDIDECEINPDICGYGGECKNTPGSYACQCEEGFRPSPDGTKCLDHRTGLCFNKIIGGLCRQTNLLEGSTRRNQMMVTKSDCCCTMGEAWGADSEDCEPCPPLGSLDFDDLCLESGFGSEGQDIDECKTLPGLCANGQCVNTMGSYRCICNRGFRADPTQGGKKCLDVDECRKIPSPCQHECENTFGSFRCSCPPGYKLNERTNICMDINECDVADLNNCEYECLNTPGSYECICPPGFSLLGHRCIDIDECVEQQVIWKILALKGQKIDILHSSIGTLPTSWYLQKHNGRLPMCLPPWLQVGREWHVLHGQE